MTISSHHLASVSACCNHWNPGRFGRINHKLLLGVFISRYIDIYIYRSIARQPSEPSGVYAGAITHCPPGANRTASVLRASRLFSRTDYAIRITRYAEASPFTFPRFLNEMP